MAQKAREADGYLAGDVATWPLTGAPGGQAAACLCSLGQGLPPCPLQSQWHLLGATLPGFALASPGSFLLTLQVSAGNVTSSEELSPLSSI